MEDAELELLDGGRVLDDEDAKEMLVDRTEVEVEVEVEDELGDEEEEVSAIDVGGVKIGELEEEETGGGVAEGWVEVLEGDDSGGGVEDWGRVEVGDSARPTMWSRFNNGRATD